MFRHMLTIPHPNLTLTNHANFRPMGQLPLLLPSDPKPRHLPWIPFLLLRSSRNHTNEEPSTDEWSRGGPTSPASTEVLTG